MTAARRRGRVAADGGGRLAVGGEAGAVRGSTALRSRGLAVLTLGAALAVAGCGGGDPEPGSDPPPRQEAPARDDSAAAGARAPTDADRIRALLAARGRALGARDARALASTARRRSDQAARDRVALRGARALRLRRVAYEIDRLSVSGARASVRARMRYAIAGTPGAHGQERRLTLRRAGGWRVTADRPASRERLPWEVARLAVTRTRHFVIARPAGLTLGRVPSQLERGYATMRDVLPLRLARRYLVVVGADPAQAEQLTSGIAGLGTLAAVADSDVREVGFERRVAEVVSQRLVLVWSNLVRIDAASQGRLVAHELTHLALARRTSGRTPGWLVEGAALLVSDDRRVFEPGAPSLAELSGPRAIARLSGARQQGAYARASAVAFQIARRYGRGAFFRLYTAFDDPDLTAANAIGLADKAVRRVLRTSLVGLDQATTRAQAGGP